VTPNLELVHRVLESFRTGDPSGFQLIAPDAVWVVTPESPVGGVYRGHAGILDFWREFRLTWDDYSNEIVEEHDLGDRVLLVTHERGRGKRGGAVVETRVPSLWSIHGGTVTRAEFFATREAADAAAL
jgi:ketosteroid isomerase-like protein